MSAKQFEKICALCPQMREYHSMPDYFTSALEWSLYTMFFNKSGHRSHVYNTDESGFRLTHCRGNLYGLDAFGTYPGRKSLIVGSSFVFGVGATSDHATLSSYLSNRTDTLFLNFGGRSHSSTQEVINVLLHLETLQGVSEIFFVSGMNNLELYRRSIPRKESSDWLFFQNRFFTALSQPPTSPKASFRKFARVAGAVCRVLYPGRPKKRRPSFPAARSILNGANSLAVRQDLLRRKISRYFSLIQLLAQRFKIYYVMQPFAEWVDKPFTAEERELFAVLTLLQGPDWSVALNTMKDDRDWYTSMVRDSCDAHDIPFFDLNNQYIDEAWYFVDRVHMTDAGYRKAADLIAEKWLR